MTEEIEKALRQTMERKRLISCCEAVALLFFHGFINSEEKKTITDKIDVFINAWNKEKRNANKATTEEVA